MDLLQIGQIVYNRRMILRLRQEDLSEMSGINMKTIRQIESGTGNPSYLTLSKVFEILGLNISVDIKRVS